MRWIPVMAIGSLLMAAACSSSPPAEEPATVEADVQDEFFASLQELCGNAYRGSVAEGSPEDSTFRDADLRMHVRECSDDVIHIPFHVGDDHSRTWVLTRTDTGIRLKHDHRLEDGSEDEITQYGGDTEDQGTATTQEFPADEFTAEMIPYAQANIWTVEVVPGERFSYALRREGSDRRFKVDFDLTETVEAPPTPWGYE